MFSGFDLRKHLIFATKTGSHAYGTSTPTSDVDIRGVTTAPLNFYLGILNHFTETSDFDITELIPGAPESNDASVMEFLKYVKLAADGNPNVIELLFIPSSHWLVDSNAWYEVQEIRHLFLSKKCRHTFSGYAHAQLKRIKTHRSWLLNPPKKKPERKDYDLPEASTISSDQLGAANSLVDRVYQGWAVSPDEEIPQNVLNKIRQAVVDMIAEVSGEGDEEKNEGLVFGTAARKAGLDDNLIEVVMREKRYRSAMTHWKQYLNWKETRNAARSELEAKYGFDTKHGMHLVRLYRMGLEIVETGNLIVDRRGLDADELLSIRNGAWTFEKVEEFADGMDKKIEEAYEKSALRNSSDKKAIDEVCLRVLMNDPDLGHYKTQKVCPGCHKNVKECICE